MPWADNNDRFCIGVSDDEEPQKGGGHGGQGATYGRFAEGDLASIIATRPTGDHCSAGEDHLLQGGTRAWEGCGQ